jgi:Flp pilus assembly protein TadD
MRSFAHNSIRSLACAAACAVAFFGAHARAADAPAKVERGQLAPLLDGTGEITHPVTTTNPRAQLFFDQGLRLVYAFNHAEAIRSFKEAQRLDPECAMAYWGEALALGPNLNQVFQPENVKPAYDAIQQAISLKAKASESERAFIDALAARYSDDPGADRATLDQAYAVAMGKVAAAYPADDDARTLYADSLMNTIPWNYFTRDGRPREKTGAILENLETVFARNPKHTGAAHLYIHATEEHYPQKSETAADALLRAAPAAGHLVHMPSHTYMRLGRYADGYESNKLAVEADESYLTQCRQQGIYPLAYYPHNVHFLMYAAERQGLSDAALFQARKVSKQAHDHMAGMDFALYESFYVMPLHMMSRFGRWDEILAEPAPEETTPFVRGIWHYARARAYLHTSQTRQASSEIKALDDLRANAGFGAMTVGFADPKVLLTIASNIVRGEMAADRGRFDDAIALLDEAVRLEDGLTYSEPPDWPSPVRHILGAALLEAGRPAQAEIVYWADLKRNPENGYSLYGLWQSLAAQERADEAAPIKARFDAAWSAADTKLTSSAF